MLKNIRTNLNKKLPRRYANRTKLKNKFNIRTNLQILISQREESTKLSY